ncbi:VOC family protein [Lactococcus taiwanensis]|uniref:VOC family protein n=1 Tax=Lactococcus taiwanensis TaxID=1151742 RepID=UPI0019646B77|nr:VOC family protein [Lactococcus taiwanensis]QRZ10685.1 VOC family protein [Lactococcus taiwanensis]
MTETIYPSIPNSYILGGVHHVTAITSSAQKIYDFFTNILGLRLAKLTVNQDDYETYHLYFTEEDGKGADMTFFDFKGIPQGKHGINNIERASFRVPSDASLDYWEERFTKAHVSHGKIQEKFGQQTLEFEDFDGQRYQLISDQSNTGAPSKGRSWQLSNVPAEHGITGLGPVFVKVENPEGLRLVLESVFGFRYAGTEGSLSLYEVAQGGNGAALILEEAAQEDVYAYQGYGTIHHLALGTTDPDSLNYWIERINAFRLPNSGLVDRFYFSSEYVRVAPGVLFEIATYTPGIGALEMAKSGLGQVDSYEEALITSGFWIDESKEESGKQLSLPPHLFPGDEATKARTAAALRPLDTSDTMRDRSMDDLWTLERVEQRKAGSPIEALE